MRHARITLDDQGPKVAIVAYITMVTMILSVGTRLAMRLSLIRLSGFDDIAVTAAMVST